MWTMRAYTWVEIPELFSLQIPDSVNSLSRSRINGSALRIPIFGMQ